MTTATRIILEIAYEGTRYSGITRQKNGDTIAAHLDRAIQKLDPGAGLIIATSRTDAGVHAYRQPISFVTYKPEIKMRSWVLALHPYLPHDISIVSAAQFPIKYDPRRHSISKRYRYRILASGSEHAFYRNRSYRVGQRLDLELMRNEATALIGCHDFRAFRSVQDVRKETERTIHRFAIEEPTGYPPLIDLVIEGDRFMHNMVRIIAGTLIDVGRGHIPPGAFQRALHSKDRIDLGVTAPARGLYLERVYLDRQGDNFWPPIAQDLHPEKNSLVE